MDNNPTRKLHPLLPASHQENATRTPVFANVSLTAKRNARDGGITSAACGQCRKRKVKCNAERPSCASCTSRNDICVYDTDRINETRAQALKRKFAEVERSRQSYEDLINIIKTKSDTEALSIMRKVQLENELDSTVQDVQAGELLLQLTRSTQPQSTRKSVDSHQYHGPDPLFQNLPSRAYVPSFAFEQPWHAANVTVPDGTFVDLNRYVLPVTKWTTVSTDNNLLNHLLLIFWTWDTMGNRVLDRTLFEEDLKAFHPMSSGAEEPLFCSSFLVNAILAYACVYSTNEAVFADLNDRLSRGAAFAREAERLLEAERDQLSLTVAQGHCALMIYEGNLGKLSTFTTHLEQIYRTVGNLPFDTWMQRYEHAVSGTRENRINQALAWIQWGFYVFESKTVHSFMRRKTIRKPNVAKYWKDENTSILASEAKHDYWWFAYPISAVPQKSWECQIFTVECLLAEIAEEVLDYLVPVSGESPVQNPARALILYNMLVNLKFSLPEPLQSTNTLPAAGILLHVNIDLVITSILDPFNKAGVHLGDIDPKANIFIHVHNMISNIWIYRALYTTRHEFFIIQQCSTVAFSVLPEIKHGGPDDFPLAKDTLNHIRTMVKQQNIDLPDYAQRVLVESDNIELETAMRMTARPTALANLVSGQAELAPKTSLADD